MKSIHMIAFVSLITAPVFAENNFYPPEIGNGFKNIHGIKEVTHDLYPGELLWYENGRPYWVGEGQAVKAAEVPQTDTVSTAQSATRTHLPSTVHYEVNRYELNDEGRATIQKFSKLSNEEIAGIKTVKITGHASEDGPTAYNQQLSNRRAAEMKRALNDLGIANSKIQAKGMGEDADSSVDEARRVNVQVETL